MIFVTLGLISQLENEAQLAFVLAHEITHYKKKHMINSFLEADKAMSRKGGYKYSSYDDNIVKLSNYSKNLELESDSLGFHMMEDAGYSINAALTVFDVLQFSYLPFEERAFDFTLFESDNFKIPKTFYLDTIIPIKFEDDYDDSKSTHPNIKKRRKKINAILTDSDKNKNSIFLVSKEDFYNTREICRFETVRNNLSNQNYVKAIYNAIILKEKHPNSIFLENSISKALYGIYKYKSIDSYRKISAYYDETEGEISRAYYFFEELTKKQAGSIALKHVWNNYNTNKDPYIKSILNDLVKSLIKENEVAFEDYHSIEYIRSYKEKLKQDSIQAIQDSIQNIQTIELAQDDTTSINNEEENESISKYEKLRKIREEKEKEKVAEIVNSESNSNIEDFYLFSLADLENIDGLNEFFSEINR